ncbi:ClC family H(+)/Cl(-) exchange transporter [Lactococcus termiticola]|uniref:Chloride channel protein n=1 Tax=Lactococcus termiticola TaxID=2169526 RepID=A0A2R5HKL0_9LACT|nr:ClC family H(+)/Cl(-) exchange transporter [Lactococcus termiticola]GBG97131.1 chloride channel protein [Lactococcus termiticola]
MESKIVSKNYKDMEKSPHKNLYLLLLSVLVGLVAGLVASLYRLSLEYAEGFGLSIYHFLAGHLIYLPLLLLAILILSAIISFLMTRYPMSSGSGIPQVKGQLLGYFKQNWFTTAFSKFIAGSLAMLGGLSLGREGPSVQLGAAMGEMVAGRWAKTERHRRLLIASGASAGLSAAFNAPLSGLMFTLEEVFKYFSPLILLTSLASAMAADFVSRLIFSGEAVFHFNILGAIPLQDYWLLVLLGLILGLFGAFYNRVLLASQSLMNKIHWPYLRVLLSFLVVASTALVFPMVVGSGHRLMDQLSLGLGIGFLALIFVLKFLISMVSYASGIPGGIFFPLLVLGASLGSIFASLAISSLHLPAYLFANFVILAMAGTFTAIVRAPLTGILLLVEMTGSFNHLLPLAFVSLIAYVMADLLKSQPIYDSLLSRMIASQEEDARVADGQMMFETILEFGAIADQKRIAELSLPEGCLIVGLHRSGRDIIPQGSSQLQAGDYLTFLIKKEDEVASRRAIRQIFTAH